ncbi:hypothetical protein WJX74_006927 [Apatococcus lobatus]|uniref:Uncharacterized protein n=2 Tax=Apatococcus TaxID=904362 RepID=A0AAW1SM35_9CHLO
MDRHFLECNIGDVILAGRASNSSDSVSFPVKSSVLRKLPRLQTLRVKSACTTACPADPALPGSVLHLQLRWYQQYICEAVKHGCQSAVKLDVCSLQNLPDCPDDV